MTKAAGWLIAAVMLVAAAGAFVWGIGQKRLADALETRLAQVTENNAALKNTLDEMGARVNQATQEIQDLEARVAKLQVAEDEATPAEEEQPGDALKTMMEALKTSAGSEEGASTKNPLAAMFSGKQGKEMARMSAQFTVPTLYGGLFKELNLPPETEARVREILVDSITEQVSLSFDAMNKKSDPEEMRKNMEAHGQRLRADLATVLTADELAVFDDYEANKERRMLESGLDVQLTMFAKGLTEENRDMFRDVIIEEMTAQGYSTNNPENYTNPGGAIERQMTAFQTARDRVVPVLPEDQAAHVDAFIQQMEGMMSAQQEMLDMFMNSGDEEEETPGDQETAQ